MFTALRFGSTGIPRTISITLCICRATPRHLSTTTAAHAATLPRTLHSATQHLPTSSSRLVSCLPFPTDTCYSCLSSLKFRVCVSRHSAARSTGLPGIACRAWRGTALHCLFRDVCRCHPVLPSGLQYIYRDVLPLILPPLVFCVRSFDAVHACVRAFIIAAFLPFAANRIAHTLLRCGYCQAFRLRAALTSFAPRSS